MTKKRHSPGLKFKLAALLIILFAFLVLSEYTLSLLYDPFRAQYTGFNKGMAATAHNFFHNDPELIWRLRENIEIPHPGPDNRMHTNSLGYRGPDFNWEKKPDCWRLVLLGDSTLFGMGLPDQETVAVKIREALKATGKTFEVINLAVPTYTSMQGLALARKHFSIMQPDMVVAGFGFTDAALVKYRDAEVLAAVAKASPLWMKPIPYLETYSYVYQLFKNVFRPPEVETYLHWKDFFTETGDPVTARVPPDEFKENMTAIVEEVQRSGGQCVLVDPNLVNFYARNTLETIANEFEIPFYSIRDILEEADPPLPFEFTERRRKNFVAVIQVQGFPKTNGQKSISPFLVKAPYGDTRFPFLPRSEYPYLHDDGAKGGDEVAKDRIYSASIKEFIDHPFEFSPSLGLRDTGMDFQFYINNTPFYRLPGREVFSKYGWFRGPVIDVSKPFLESCTYPFEKPLINRSGVARIVAKLMPLILEEVDPAE